MRLARLLKHTINLLFDIKISNQSQYYRPFTVICIYAQKSKINIPAHSYKVSGKCQNDLWSEHFECVGHTKNNVRVQKSNKNQHKQNQIACIADSSVHLLRFWHTKWSPKYFDVDFKIDNHFSLFGRNKIFGLRNGSSHECTLNRIQSEIHSKYEWSALY